ncbi:enhancer of mRNA-decapping protein 4-like [Adelges cooleyi]|uniref:enhancer of mRNA-decapping protein 4-like n=1 Tax=Adelges cooleyi TaxID=133065 RepID=UPI00217F24BA|nr:enhancer of mRNA-decapping protein 4-like [Adelges cooleyi]
MENTVQLRNVQKNKNDPNGNDAKSRGSQLNNSKPPEEKPQNQGTESGRTKIRKKKSKINQKEVQGSVEEKTKTKGSDVDLSASTVKCIEKNKISNKINKSDQPAANITPSQDKVRKSDTGQVQNPKNRSSIVKATRLDVPSVVPAAAANDEQDGSGNYSTNVETEVGPVMDTECTPLCPARKIEPVKTQKLTRQLKRMHIRIRQMNEKLKAVTKKQKKIERRMKSYETTQNDPEMIVSEVCRLIEPTLKTMVYRTTDEAYTDFETTFIQKLTVMQNTFTGIDSKHISEMVFAFVCECSTINLDNETLSTTLSQPLPKVYSMGVVLDELFRTTVVPKIKQAFWFMFEKMQKVMDDIRSDCSLQDDEVHVKRSKFVNYAKKFLEGGNFVEALEMALVTIDLKLVLYVCEHITIPPQDLFQFASIQTRVLLPLMQQLSCDLKMNTELKYKYLEAAVKNFDPKNFSYKKNLKSILNNIDNDIEYFLIQEPRNPYCCKIETLQLELKKKIHLLN